MIALLNWKLPNFVFSNLFTILHNLEDLARGRRDVVLTHLHMSVGVTSGPLSEMGRL